MIKIRIAYDPYHIKTSLSINGQNVKRNSVGYEQIAGFVKQNIPLQSWIDPISFQKWPGLLFGAIGNTQESKVEVIFRGRELDFIDLRESLDRQSKNGEYDVDITYKPTFIFNDQQILDRVKTAYALIDSDNFKQILNDKLFNLTEDSPLKQAYAELPSKYADAMNGEFRIVFSGMYTCGKSTIINAILGKEILPTRDGTCTSKVFEIHHDANVPFARMYCIDKNQKVVVKEQVYNEVSLKAKFDEIFPRNDEDKLLPSNPPTIDRVRIFTNLSNLYPSDASYNTNSMNLVIIDTPGTSSGEGNSLANGNSHRDITEGVIASKQKEMVVFATSAIEDKDDSIQDFLDMVDKNSDGQNAYDQRFLFVLNKADCVSLKTGESWEQKLRGIRNYYINSENPRTIKNPRFFPTSALGAFSIRCGRLKSSDYKSVEAKYYYPEEDQDGNLRYVQNDRKTDYHFDEFCSTSQAIKDKISMDIRRLAKSELSPRDRRSKEIEFHSGIVSLEMAIQDYVAKYAFPLKVQSLIATYDTIFKETNQLVSIAQKNFEQAVNAMKSAENARQAKEKDETRAKREQESLITALDTIRRKKDRLDTISSDFVRESSIQTNDIKARMNEAIQSAKEKAIENPKDFEIRSQIQSIVDLAAKECRNQIQSRFDENSKKAKIVEDEINGFFREIKSLIDFGDGFKIEDTTVFKEISTESIAEIKDAYKDVRNPDLDYHGWNPFKHIKKLFVSDTVRRNVGINMVDLDSALKDIRHDFNQKVDTSFNSAQQHLTSAVDQLKHNLDILQIRIKEYAQNLNNLRDTINDLARDASKHGRLSHTFSTYKQVLAEINKQTNFIDVDEE